MKSSIVGIAIAALVVGMVGGYMIGMSSSKDDGSDNKSANQEMKESADTKDGVTVGGAKMVRTLDIVDNAANAKNVSTVVDLVKQAGLVDTLKSEGPFTVFGPSNEAFEAVPKDVLSVIAGNNEYLKTVLTYHVIPGTYTTADLRAMANSGESVKTVQGGELSFKIVDGDVVVVDTQGQEVKIETPDIISSNGVTHVVKNVLLPLDPATLK
jgi:uncharacterized surface protein with fasciclin (FAS1) repeats